MNIYVLLILFCANKHNQNATKYGNRIPKKLCECLSDFLDLTNLSRIEERVDGLKLCKFGRTCSNWLDTIGRLEITRLESQ